MIVYIQQGRNLSLTKILKGNSALSRKLSLLLPELTPAVTKNNALLAPPLTNHYGLVGTAFDYLLRFEIQKRYTVEVRGWIAEAALARLLGSALGKKTGPSLTASDLKKIERITGSTESRVITGNSALKDKNGNIPPKLIPVLWKQGNALVGKTKSILHKYLKSRDESWIERLCESSLKLAKLDSIFRAGFVDIPLDDVDQEDVEDLRNLLKIVPWSTLDPYLGQRTLLNPSFRDYSRLMCGADADMIAGSLLIDIKTVKAMDQRKYAAQLVGYGILANKHQQEDNSFPKVTMLGLYYSRFGILQTIQFKDVIRNPSYQEAEQDLLEASKVHSFTNILSELK